LYVSERGVVVFRHADPVLCDLSPTLLDGAAGWTMVVSIRRMRCGIFRALCLARALAPKWIMGARRFRSLSIAGICARDVVGDVVYAITRPHGMVPSSRRRIRSRPDPLPRGAATLQRALRLHLCR